MRLTPAGRGSLTRVTPRTFRVGIRPLPFPGVFPHGMLLPRRLVGLALIRVTTHGIRLPLLSGVRSDPPAPAQGVPYRNPVLLECPVLCTSRPLTGTIPRLPHGLQGLCLRLTVRVPRLRVTHTSSLPPCGSDYSSLLGYGHSHAIRCVSSPFDPASCQTVITLTWKPHLPIAAHIVHAVCWFGFWVR